MGKPPKRRRGPDTLAAPPIGDTSWIGPGDRPTTIEDEWQAQITREAAVGIGRWLESRGKLHMPIASLTLSDLQAMAVAAISIWATRRAERTQEPEISPDDPSVNLLLG